MAAASDGIYHRLRYFVTHDYGSRIFGLPEYGRQPLVAGIGTESVFTLYDAGVLTGKRFTVKLQFIDERIIRAFPGYGYHAA